MYKKSKKKIMGQKQERKTSLFSLNWWSYAFSGARDRLPKVTIECKLNTKQVGVFCSWIEVCFFIKIVTATNAYKIGVSLKSDILYDVETACFLYYMFLKSRGCPAPIKKSCVLFWGSFWKTKKRDEITGKHLFVDFKMLPLFTR